MRCKYKADTSKYRQNTSNTSRIHPEAVSSVHQTDTYIPWALSITIWTETHQTQSKTPKGQLNALKLYHQHRMPTPPRACPLCCQIWKRAQSGVISSFWWLPTHWAPHTSTPTSIMEGLYQPLWIRGTFLMAPFMYWQHGVEVEDAQKYGYGIPVYLCVLHVYLARVHWVC